MFFIVICCYYLCSFLPYFPPYFYEIGFIMNVMGPFLHLAISV